MDRDLNSYPSDRRYSPDHLWIDAQGRLGVTARLARWLPRIVAVHLPPLETEVFAAQPFGAIEAEKGTFDLHAPCDGRVIERNSVLESSPELVNDDPHGRGWLARIEAAPARLLDAAEYEQSPGYQFPAFDKRGRR